MSKFNLERNCEQHQEDLALLLILTVSDGIVDSVTITRDLNSFGHNHDIMIYSQGLPQVSPKL